MIKGIDIGYSTTKDEQRNIINSSFCRNENILANGHKLQINNELYYVGIGNGTLELDKVDSQLNELCLITMIGLSVTGYQEIKLVTGLPIDQFKSQKEKFKNKILNHNKYHFFLDDRECNFIIRDVLIFPQAAGALFSQKIQEDALIVDIGSRTVDIALFEWNDERHSLVKHTTLFKGIYVLSSSIAQQVNTKFNISLESHHAERILTTGLSINGQKQDISFLQGVLQSHFESIFNELYLNYPVQTTQIYLAGGGANLFYQAFYNRFKNTKVLTNPQFANAIGFYQIGLKMF